MSGTNVGELNVKIGMDTAQLRADANIATATFGNMENSVAQLKKSMNFDNQLDNAIAKLKQQQTLEDQMARDRIADARTAAAVEETMRQKAINRVLADERGSGVAALQNRMGMTGARAGGSGKIANAVAQAGYGLQDFASQLETRGIGPAIGAITNNVQMLGAAFGPVGLAVTAVGGAVAGIVLPKFVEWLNQTELLKAQAEELATKFRLASELKDKLAEITVKGGADDARKAAEEQIRINELRQGDAGKELAREVNKAQQLRQQLNASSVDLGGGIRIAKIGHSGSAVRQLEIDLQMQEEVVKRHEGRFRQIVDSTNQARELLRNIGPGTDNAEAAQMDDLNQRRRTSFERAAKRMEEDAKQAIEDEKRALESQQADIQGQLTELRQSGIEETKVGAATMRGTSAATSAINRATSGQKSIENDNRRKIKLLEDQLHSLQQIKQQLNFKQAQF